jgi:hypothetical protein
MPEVDIQDWVGIVQRLGSNNDGNGTLTVRIGDRIALKTWNNSLSDTGAGTLITHGSDLFAAASQLREGQLVRFSGSLFPNRSDCYREASLGVAGSMTEPEFVFRFEAIRPL